MPSCLWIGREMKILMQHQMKQTIKQLSLGLLDVTTTTTTKIQSPVLFKTVKLISLSLHLCL
jgi:hypothetical protein